MKFNDGESVNAIVIGCDTFQHLDEQLDPWIDQLPGNAVVYTMVGSTVGDRAHATALRRHFTSRRYPSTPDSLKNLFKDACSLTPGVHHNAILIALHPFLGNSEVTRSAVGYAIARMMPVVLIEHDDDESSVGRWIGYGPVVPEELLENYQYESQE